MKLKVSSLQNNQYVVTIGSEIYFQSYETIIAKVDKNKNVILSNYWNYSRTTLKWLKVFLQKYTEFYPQTKKDIERLILNKKVKLVKEIEYEC
jgi:ribonucleotide reductase beta subunit family protein with ferritin-like domain